MAGAPEKFTVEEVVKAAKECRGMAYVMARQLGCSAKTVYNYRDRYDEVREAMEDEHGYVDDVAELKLFEAIQDGEAWAIKFRLQQGDGRDYADRHEHSGGGAMQLIIRDSVVEPEGGGDDSGD